MRKNIISLLSSVFFLCVFIIFLIGSLLFLFHENGPMGKEDINTFDYRHFTHNFRKNLSSFGIVTISQKLDENEFISYQSGDGSGIFSLVSNFGSQEYYCSGSCYCGESEYERRNAGNSETVVRGLKYLLVAVTSAYAYTIAKNHFEEECKKKFEDDDVLSCPSDSVHFEVENCESIIDTEDLKKKYLEEEEYEHTDDLSLYEKFLRNVEKYFEFTREEAEEYLMKTEYDYKEYVCRGNCLKRDMRKIKSEDYIRKVEEFDCEGLKLELLSGGIGPVVHFEMEFIEILHNYCLSQSRMAYKIKMNPRFNPKGIRRSNACVGGVPIAKRPKRGGKNPTITCQNLKRYDFEAPLIN